MSFKYSRMIEQLLQLKTSEAISQLYGQVIPPGLIGVEKTKKEITGDYTVVVFPLSKISRKSPEVTAQEIGRFLVKNIDHIREFAVIKGFLNIILGDEFWIAFLDKHLYDDKFGIKAQGRF